MIKIYPLIDTLQILDISDECYFNDYRDYISNSRLSLINPDQGGSVEKFLAKEKISSGSLLLGSAVHAAVLQPGEFSIFGNVGRPTAKLGLMADELAKNYPNITDEMIIAASDKIDYYKGKMNEKRISDVRTKCQEYWGKRKYMAGDNNLYLDDASFIKYKSCVKSINDNVEIQKLLHPEGLFDRPVVNNELAIIIEIRAVNTETKQTIDLPFKAKLDNFSIIDNDILVLNDLKTTGHLLQDFPGSFEKYHYYRQMGVYAWLLKLAADKLANQPIFSFTANMLVVSTVPDFHSQVFKVKTSDIIRGFNEFKYLMRKVAEIYV